MSIMRAKKVAILCVCDNGMATINPADARLIERLMDEGYMCEETAYVADNDHDICGVIDRWLAQGDISVILTLDTSQCSAADIPQAFSTPGTAAIGRLTRLVHDKEFGLVGISTLPRLSPKAA